MTYDGNLASFVGGRVIVLVGDITAQHADAIVNAANSSLLGGGGVDGAIHHRGGPEILEACRALRRDRFPGGMPTGEVALTTAGRLPARFVIHTVGPIRKLGSAPDAAMLARCYRNALLIAAENNLRTVAFPSIATGAYAYPREEAAGVVSQTIEAALCELDAIEQVRLVFYCAEDAAIFIRFQNFTDSRRTRGPQS
jgi:O-acetyl-ADP-ribose deacetylase